MTAENLTTENLITEKPQRRLMLDFSASDKLRHMETAEQPKDSAETPPAKQSKPNQRKRRDRGRDRKRPKKRQHRPKRNYPPTRLDLVRESFFACGRCSYFFSGMRAKLSLATVTEMAELSEHGWLETRWERSLQDVVEGAYGVHVRSDSAHFSHACLECGRSLVVSADEDGELAYFEVQWQRQAAHLPADRERKLPTMHPVVTEQPPAQESEISAEVEQPPAVETEPDPTLTPPNDAADPPQTA